MIWFVDWITCLITEIRLRYQIEFSDYIDVCGQIHWKIIKSTFFLFRNNSILVEVLIFNSYSNTDIAFSHREWFEANLYILIVLGGEKRKEI